MQAWAGSPGFRGDPAGPPISIGGDLGEYMGGVFAAFGVLAVRRRVEHGGPGEHLDLSMLEAMTLMQSSEWLHSQLLRVPPVSRTTEVPSIEPAKDGYVGITMVTGQQWLDFLAMVDCPQLEEIEQLRFQIGRWGYRDLIREQIGPWLAERTVAEIVELGQLFRLPIAALGNGATIREVGIRAPSAGYSCATPPDFDQPRPPWLMSACAPAPVRDTAAPGADNDESPWRKSEPEHDPAPPARPLDGVRIVDLTAFWAGPAATHLLAAFGAEVIKVESIQRPGRHSLLGRNAQRRGRLVGVRLGIPRDEHQQAFGDTWIWAPTRAAGCSQKLAAGADVVIENFSPRVMDQFGLTADTLLEVNPKLVVARMPAFGLDGPWRERVGFAPTMEQIAGLAWVTGLPDAPPVTPRGACDPLAGVHAAFAVLAALNFAERAGTGQLLELPMLETVLNATAIQAIESEVFGKTLSRRGNRGFGGVIQNLYRCAGAPDEDDWIAVTVRDDQQWSALVDLMGRPAWCDEGLATVAGRRERADDIDRRLQEWFAGQPLAVDGPAAGRRGCSRRARCLAVVGDRESPTARPGLLRDAGALEHRVSAVSLPAVRLAVGPGPVAVAPAAVCWASTMGRYCAIGAG